MRIIDFDLTEKHPIGHTNIKASAISFGCWGISSANWGKDLTSREAISILDAAWERGINLFDTAAVYGNGFGELILGNTYWKNEAVIATKVSARQKPLLPIQPINEYYEISFVENEINNSLRRLKRDHIDILQLHNWYDEWDSQADYIFDFFQKLKMKGKIRAVGISLPDWSNADITQLISRQMIDVVQVPFNLFQQWAMNQIVTSANQLGVGFLSRSPLDQGALASLVSKLEDLPELDIRKSKYRDDRFLTLKMRIQYICETVGISNRMLPYYGLAYCLAQPGISSVIVGMQTRIHVKENTRLSNYKFSSAQLEKGKLFEWKRGW